MTTGLIACGKVGGTARLVGKAPQSCAVLTRYQLPLGKLSTSVRVQQHGSLGQDFGDAQSKKSRIQLAQKVYSVPLDAQYINQDDH